MDLQLKELPVIKPEELDDFLALGWFRIQQTIFTTNTLQFNNQEYKAIWLRVNLHDFHPDKRYLTLKKRNKNFRIEIQKAIISPQHEILFSSYKKGISFETAPSLHWLLYGSSIRNIYNTYMINVYDDHKLIGSGFFDLGDTSAAGICCVYDPGYKKYSLGKYMIYEKMLYCKRGNFAYFYPGYFVPGYAMFDYKLELGKPAIQYFDAHTQTWFPLIYEEHQSEINFFNYPSGTL